MRKKSRVKIIVLLFVFAILLIGVGRNIAVKRDTIISPKSTKADYSVITSKMSKYIDNYSLKDKFSGTVLVAKDNQVILDKGYGMADVTNKITNKPKTIFEIASLTKQFTSTAILMLQQKKLLNVQDTIDKYIPGYPEGNKIKIYNLLTHTSGIPDYNQTAISSGVHTYTLKEIIRLFKHKPRHFASGTKYEYSSSNYILLGYIIGRLSHMKYEDYIEKNIVEPLLLKDTGFVTNGTIIKNEASGYNLDKKTGKYIKTTDHEGEVLYSAGGIYSTVDDLYVWQNALFGKKFINKNSLNAMCTPDLHSYGYGLIITKKLMEIQ